jgi:aspartyl aminopeptidase
VTDLTAARDLCAFIDASPSPFHLVASVASRLEAAGFGALDERDAWDGGGRRYVVRDGSLAAWVAPEGLEGATPWRFVGAHTDSPNLRVKPRPDLARAGVRQLGVEVYGGPLLNSWLDRDLGLSGRVALRGGEPRLLRVDRPVLRIPQLAIHLDREIMTAGLQLNAQQHLVPIWGVGGGEEGAFRRFVADELGVAPADVLAWDLMVHDVNPSAVVGQDDELIAAPRLDNQCSCWAGIDALLEVAPALTRPAMVVLFDHEEVGSGSAQGAASPLVETVLERVLGGDRESMRRALAGSLCASADMAHATHPNYAERHEPNHWIALNGGPVIKQNASLRYATSARSAAAFVEACERAGVPVQHYVNRNDLPCGSTIGPITAARLGIESVDVGAPQLAMHSARETMGSADPALYRAALAAFLSPV